MTKEEAISRIQRALSVPNRLQGLVLIDEESANKAIEALSVNNKAVYCWECKYQHECVQCMMVEGKYEIIHSCSYGKRREL